MVVRRTFVRRVCGPDLTEKMFDQNKARKRIELLFIEQACSTKIIPQFCGPLSTEQMFQQEKCTYCTESVQRVYIVYKNVHNMKDTNKCSVKCLIRIKHLIEHFQQKSSSKKCSNRSQTSRTFVDRTFVDTTHVRHGPQKDRTFVRRTLDQTIDRTF